MTTIAELFDAEQSDTVTVRGRIVRSLARFPVAPGDRIVVTRRQVSAPRPQAIKLACTTGQIEVAGTRAETIALWSTTSPDVVEGQVVATEPGILEVWNAWMLGGVDTAWIGNAGMIVKAADTGHLLRCSDGVGEPDFSDLVVYLEIHPA